MKRCTSHFLPQAGTADNRRAGFTLIEMLTVVSVLGILTAIALPRIDWQRYRVNSEIRNVVMALTYAQRLAVSLQHDVVATVDAPQRRLRIHEDANNNGIVDVNERVTFYKLEQGITFGRPGVPDLPPPAPTNVLTQIIFRRDGSASSAGVIYLTTQRSLTDSTTADARALEIARATGRAVWYSYASGNWVRGK
ncbi:MAG: pilus assembly FimT family protein [Gemmatimonadota bacterium]